MRKPTFKRLAKIGMAISPLFLICLGQLGIENALAHRRSESGEPKPAAQSEKQDVHACRFQQSGAEWKGACTPVIRENPAITITPAKQITTGIWRKGVEPTAVWTGKMTHHGDLDPFEIEVYANGQGVMRTASGWFPISKYQASASDVQFEVDLATEVPANDLDREIIERAAAILSSDAVWNRADNRKCSPTDTKWSIYCAMEKATIEVTGAFHHRRPALELVREIVGERAAGRNYLHWLRDYNNDRSTQLKDVQSLFGEALARMPK